MGIFQCALGHISDPLYFSITKDDVTTTTQTVRLNLSSAFEEVYLDRTSEADRKSTTYVELAEQALVPDRAAEEQVDLITQYKDFFQGK